MTKSDLIRLWKPELRPLGFQFLSGMFQLRHTLQQPMQFMVAIQRNLHDNTFQINPSIVLANPLIEPRKQELLLRGKLCPTGIQLHAPPTIWWPVSEVGEALRLLKTISLPWFEKWGQACLLAEKAETAILKNRSLIDVLEPTNDQEFERIWHESASPRYLTPTTYYQVAVLHYLCGNFAMAVVRTKDWLAQLDSHQVEEIDRAKRQLAALGQLQ